MVGTEKTAVKKINMVSDILGLSLVEGSRKDKDSNTEIGSC